MKKMTTIFLVLVVLLALPVLDFCVDAAPAVTFPGKFGFEYTTTAQLSIVDNQMKTIANGNRSAQDGSDQLADAPTVIFQTLKGTLSFPVVSWYSNAIWIQEQLQLRLATGNSSAMDDSTNLAGLSLPTSTLMADAATEASDTMRIRNRLSFGFDNTFKIPDILNIEISVDLRLGNDSWSTNPYLGRDDNPGNPYGKGKASTQNPYVRAYTEMRLEFVPSLSGSYPFGINSTAFIPKQVNPIATVRSAGNQS